MKTTDKQRKGKHQIESGNVVARYFVPIFHIWCKSFIVALFTFFYYITDKIHWLQFIYTYKISTQETSDQIFCTDVRMIITRNLFSVESQVTRTMNRIIRKLYKLIVQLTDKLTDNALLHDIENTFNRGRSALIRLFAEYDDQFKRDLQDAQEDNVWNQCMEMIVKSSMVAGNALQHAKQLIYLTTHTAIKNHIKSYDKIREQDWFDVNALGRGVDINTARLIAREKKFALLKIITLKFEEAKNQVIKHIGNCGNGTLQQTAHYILIRTSRNFTNNMAIVDRQLEKIPIVHLSAQQYLHHFKYIALYEYNNCAQQSFNELFQILFMIS